MAGTPPEHVDAMVEASRRVGWMVKHARTDFGAFVVIQEIRMKEIYVNLKRFDVPRSLGGLCPVEDPVTWIKDVITDSLAAGMGENDELSLVYLLPESLIPAAVCVLDASARAKARMLEVGCQGVHWDNVTVGGNFGAFTTALPAAAASNLGAAGQSLVIPKSGASKDMACGHMIRRSNLTYRK